jgi:hypothetical protein
LVFYVNKSLASLLVDGTGVKAKFRLNQGEKFHDRDACFIKGAPPVFSEEQYNDDNGDSWRVIIIFGKKGYFKIKNYSSEKEKKDSTTFYINEARDGAKANIKWTAINGEMLGWLIIKDIEKDEELLAEYLP